MLFIYLSTSVISWIQTTEKQIYICLYIFNIYIYLCVFYIYLSTAPFMMTERQKARNTEKQKYRKTDRQKDTRVCIAK